MALSLDQLNAITTKYYVKKLHDNIFDSNPLLTKFKETNSYVSVNGGTNILVPLNYAQTTASGWFSGSDTLSTADNDNITSASYDWKSAFAGVAITEEDELKNSGDAAVLNLLKSKQQIAEKTLKDIIGTGLYSDGSTTKSIVGLRDIVATAQTVGGISQNDYSWWRGQVDSTTTTNTISKMNASFQNAAVGNDVPNFIVGTRSTFNSYYALLQPMQRFTNEKMASGGFENLTFNGAPFTIDSHVPSGYIFFLNLNYLSLFYHPERDFSFEPFAKPLDQQIKISRYLWMGALGSSNNRMHAAMTALTA